MQRFYEFYEIHGNDGVKSCYSSLIELLFIEQRIKSLLDYYNWFELVNYIAYSISWRKLSSVIEVEQINIGQIRYVSVLKSIYFSHEKFVLFFLNYRDKRSYVVLISENSFLRNICNHFDIITWRTMFKSLHYQWEQHTIVVWSRREEGRKQTSWIVYAQRIHGGKGRSRSL